MTTDSVFRYLLTVDDFAMSHVELGGVSHRMLPCSRDPFTVEEAVTQEFVRSLDVVNFPVAEDASIELSRDVRLAVVKKHIVKGIPISTRADKPKMPTLVEIAGIERHPLYLHSSRASLFL